MQMMARGQEALEHYESWKSLTDESNDGRQLIEYANGWISLA
jgi:hypothetical protein